MSDCKKCKHNHICWGFGWFDLGWASPSTLYVKEYMRGLCMERNYILFEEKEKEDDTVPFNIGIDFSNIFPFNFFSSGSRRYAPPEKQTDGPGMESSTR